MRLFMQFLRYEWRTKQLRLLCIALILAIASLTTVSFLTERVNLVLEQQAQTLLTADLVLHSDTPLDPQWEQDAVHLGMRVAKSTTMMSMLFANQQTHLVEIKAISSLYPLYGRLEIAPWSSSQNSNTPRYAVDPKLVSKLGIGPQTPLQIGEATFFATGRIITEPGQTLDFTRIAPRVIVTESLLTQTKLIQFGSRIKYRLFVASPNKTRLHQFKLKVQKELKQGQVLEEATEARPEVRDVLTKVKQFLNVVALLSVFFAFLASLISLQHYIRENKTQFAVLKCLGLTRFALLRLYLALLCFIAIITGILGLITGLFIQALAPVFFPEVFENTMLTVLSIFKIGIEHIVLNFIIVVGIAAPFLFQLVHIPAFSLLREETAQITGYQRFFYLLGLISIAFVFAYKTNFEWLGWMSLASFSAAFLIMTVLIVGCLYLLYRFRFILPKRFYFLLTFLKKRAWAYGIQSASLTLGLALLLILTLVRHDLIENWQAQLPPETPNRFVINIQPDQLEDVKKMFSTVKVLNKLHFYPMVRGRLIEINQKPVRVENYSDRRTRQLLTREFNLSYAQNVLINPSSRLVQGTAWTQQQASKENLISIEKDLAARFGLKIGDTLTYSVSGEKMIGRIFNIRTVKWNSFEVNFFVIFSPTFLEQAAKSWITSFYLPPNAVAFETKLTQAFPNLTIIDTTHIVQQIQSLIDKIILLIQGVFMFALLAGLLILNTVFTSIKKEQHAEISIQKYLGATTKRLLTDKLFEIICLGSITGFIAASLALFAEWGFSYYVFDMTIRFNSILLFIGILCGIGCYFLTFSKK